MLKIRIRVIVGIMIFLGYFLIYVVRYNLSVHLVDMVQMSKREIERITLKSGRNESIRKAFDSRKGTILDVMFWDEIKMAQLFSAYHIGYCICFPIFHNIGDRIGPTWVVGIAGMVSGILNCLTPASAYHHFWSFFLVRVIKGFCAGAMLPSMVQVLRHWVPPFERNHFMWAYCGITTGTCSTFLICAAVHFYSRWPVGFYVCGAMQILWSTAWVFAVSDSPRKHPCITDEELEYLSSTIGNVFTIKVRLLFIVCLCRKRVLSTFGISTGFSAISALDDISTTPPFTSSFVGKLKWRPGLSPRQVLRYYQHYL
ncbi:PREDICTED: sialin-like [Papilio polytes]|uniref:sialin-like n=1 Tax=Papilio polytes TaxID=76194 RepID=UPI00067682B7|nr:PREDICTED: sialin-like [Papilio polytes]